jgi:5-methylcytosine-specific restriction endonuclease McrA
MPIVPIEVDPATYPPQTCTQCGESKLISEYYRTNPNRTAGRCKSCLSTANKKWRIENADRRAEYMRQYRAENVEAIRAINRRGMRKHRSIHPDDPGYRQARIDASKDYRANNTAKVAENRRRRYLANPEKYHAAQHRYRALKRGGGGRHTADEWLELKDKYGHVCLMCGVAEPEIKLSRDHIVPICRGGWDDIGNIQPLCRPCNSVKGTRVLDLRPDRIALIPESDHSR